MHRSSEWNKIDFCLFMGQAAMVVDDADGLVWLPYLTAFGQCESDRCSVLLAFANVALLSIRYPLLCCLSRVRSTRWISHHLIDQLPCHAICSCTIYCYTCDRLSYRTSSPTNCRLPASTIHEMNDTARPAIVGGFCVMLHSAYLVFKVRCGPELCSCYVPNKIAADGCVGTTHRP